MWNTAIWLKSHKRQPVRLAPPRGLRDPQQHLPVSWCARCGGEIFGRKCPACREGSGHGKAR